MIHSFIHLWCYVKKAVKPAEKIKIKKFNYLGGCTVEHLTYRNIIYFIEQYIHVLSTYFCICHF